MKLLRLLPLAILLVLQSAGTAAAQSSPPTVTCEGRLITHEEAKEILKRYHSIPGGFVLGGEAIGVEWAKIGRYEPALNAFVLDGRAVYAFPIPARTVAVLARAIAEDDRVGVSLGEEVEIVYGGMPKNSDVAVDMKLADNFLGDIILPPQEWTIGYRFANGFEPRRDVGTRNAAVFFQLTDFQFAVNEQKLQLTRAHFDARIVPIIAKQAPDGGYLPDFDAISAGVGFEEYEVGAKHLGENIDYYLREKIVERALAYGEAAAFLRGLKAAGIDLRKLAHSADASSGKSASGRAPARTLENSWVKYLIEIQKLEQYANWSAPPYDLYLNRKTISSSMSTLSTDRR